MSEKFEVPMPDDAFFAAYIGRNGRMADNLRDAFREAVPGIVRAEVERALTQAGAGLDGRWGYLDAIDRYYLAARFGAAPECRDHGVHPTGDDPTRHCPVCVPTPSTPAEYAHDGNLCAGCGAVRPEAGWRGADIDPTKGVPSSGLTPAERDFLRALAAYTVGKETDPTVVLPRNLLVAAGRVVEER